MSRVVQEGCIASCVRHPVTALHALFISGFSFWAWYDLAQMVLRTQPQNSIMPMLLLLWYLPLPHIANWANFLVDCCGWPPSSFYCVCAPCSLACDQE